MILFLPFLPLVAIGAAVTAAEAIGIGAGAIGIGAGIKGTLDYNKAQSLQNDAHLNYRNMVAHVRTKAAEVKQCFARFAKLKLQTYTGIIQETAQALSYFKHVELSSFMDASLNNIDFTSINIDEIVDSCIKASDVFGALAAGVNAAFYAGVPPKGKLPPILLAAIGAAGLSWGIFGNNAKTAAMHNATELEAENASYAIGVDRIDAIIARIDDGERLIAEISSRLQNVLGDITEEMVPTVVLLVKALKQVIEADIIAEDGVVSKQTGVIFQKLYREYVYEQK